jgi:RNA polymerase subunit RPABC4/transcription elongation factor Spt4
MLSSLDPQALQTILTYLTALFGAFLAALWLSLIFWTYRDARARTHDRLMQVLAALIVAILNMPGILVYLILRPQYTLDETYQHTLEEEALLTEIEESRVCPGCGSRIQPDWLVCPSCHTKLHKACAHCGKSMQLHWKICPYCATPEPGLRTTEESYQLEPGIIDELD